LAKAVYTRTCPRLPLPVGHAVCGVPSHKWHGIVRNADGSAVLNTSIYSRVARDSNPSIDTYLGGGSPSCLVTLTGMASDLGGVIFLT
jgi:hypothetical protein